VDCVLRICFKIKNEKKKKENMLIIEKLGGT